jgi:Flp pilus assembly protein TadD
MGTRRKPISPRHAVALIALIALSGLTGCIALGGRPATDALTPAEHLKLGVSYEHAGKPELALREYRRAAVGPLQGAALSCQGNIYAAQGQVVEAEAAYRAALALEPDNPVALNNLAWLLCQEGRSLDEAEQLVRRAIALDVEPRATYQDTLAAILAAQ